MCGICGIYNYRNDELASPQLLEQMLTSIYHRGPDEDGRHIDAIMAMGMRRLSIIDLIGGKQPIYNEDETIALVFNGEIYNYRDLQAELRQKGHQLTTDSDTEVIVHLYEEYGFDCVKHLRGMFVFSIWDSKNMTLFIARDHLGIKPLYYTNVGGRFVFASEIKAILQHPDVKAHINLKALSDYISLRYVAAPETLFDGIYALMAGHRIICTADDLHVEAYWDVDFQEIPESEQLSEHEYLEELSTLARESVKMRLMSDVPFGAFLSGGVDSSTVVALMSEYLDHPIKTFTVGFKGTDAEESFSELRYAKVVADHYKTDHHEVLVTADDFINLTEKISYHLDQPLADYAEVGYYAVCNLASQHVKMVLTGEGGDELFAGYGRYTAERQAAYFQHVPNGIMLLGVKTINGLPKLRRPKAAMFAYSLKDTAERHINWIPNFNSMNKQIVLTDAVKEQLGTHETSEIFSQYLQKTSAKDIVNQMLYTDTKVWLPDYLLSRGDKLTMSVSLEGRVPLLDYKLVEFAAKVPSKFKINNGTRKYLLKQFARQLLPAGIIDRTKKGFPVPIPVWLREQANDMMHDLLSKDTIEKRGYFNSDFVHKLMREHEDGFADHATMLYGLINLEIWHRQYLDRQVPAMHTFGV